ncbi:hypothetical protein [Brevundimonas diminuta]|uniref:hypothetical protein n=1 Tax=Brevundimonas diminuta TaxID=293 RepID=UPI0030F95A14
MDIINLPKDFTISLLRQILTEALVACKRYSLDAAKQSLKNFVDQIEASDAEARGELFVQLFDRSV